MGYEQLISEAVRKARRKMVDKTKRRAAKPTRSEPRVVEVDPVFPLPPEDTLVTGEEQIGGVSPARRPGHPWIYLLLSTLFLGLVIYVLAR